MPRADRTVNVFLASPGDVQDDRQAVFDTILRVEQMVARPLGWTVRPWGWELRRPGLGRAQDLINPRVDNCDVLIGLLHLGFGTPTGDYESGFEEEFERLRRRRDDGDDVDAMIYLREVGGDTADPRNLAFRERLKSLALYDSYDVIDELRSKLFAHLASLVAEWAGEGQGEVAADAGSSLVQAPPASAALPPSHGGESAAAEALAKVASGLAEADEDARPDRTTVVRAQLATSTELSNRFTSSLMHIHDLVRVYEDRHAIELSRRERYFVGRSMIGIGDTAPGWGMLADMGTRELGVLLFDRSQEVRAGAVRELGAEGLDAFARETAQALEDMAPHEVLAALWEREEDPSIRRAVVDSIARSGLDGIDLLLAAIRAAERGEEVGAFRGLAERWLDADPQRALELYVDTPVWMPDDALERLKRRATALDRDRLEELTTGARPARRAAYELLRAAGWLSADTVGTLLSDDDHQVRRVGLAEAIDLGIPMSDALVDHVLQIDGKWAADDQAYQLRLQFLKRSSPDDLLARGTLDRLGLAGGLAIRAAMELGDQRALALARADLVDGLDDARARARTAIEESGGDPEEVARQLEMLERYAKTLEGAYVESLLRGLAAAGDSPADAELAVSFLADGQPSIAEAALEVVLSRGRPEDADALINAAAGLHGKQRRRVLARVLKIRPDAQQLLDALALQSQPDNELGPALHAIADAGLTIPLDALDGYLRNARPEVRQGALRLAVAGRTRDELGHLVDAYLGADAYRYYDVVGTLDRLAYAPEPIRSVARRRLEAKSRDA